MVDEGVGEVGLISQPLLICDMYTTTGLRKKQLTVVLVMLPHRLAIHEARNSTAVLLGGTHADVSEMRRLS